MRSLSVARTLAAVALGHAAHEDFVHNGKVYLVDDQGDIEPFPQPTA